MDHLWLFSLYLEESEEDKLMLAADQDNDKEMIAILKKKVKEMGNDVVPAIYADMAYIYYMVNDIDNAVLFYSKAIEILDSEGDYNHSPGFASYLIEYAEILKEKKEYQKSLECFFKVRKIFKD
ncbi:MAG: hypothetical protein J7L96_08400, partial [Bacteroidales bacterium]|nr:hypothetical protein [Bacteroidales bacterium]